MKKTLLSVAVSLLISTTAFAQTPAEIEKAAQEAIQKIEMQKEQAIKELKVKELKAKETTEKSVSIDSTKIDLPSAEVFQKMVDEDEVLSNYGIKVNRSVADLGFGDFYEITLAGRDNGVLHYNLDYAIIGDIFKFENGVHKNISSDYRTNLQKDILEKEIELLGEKEEFISYKSKAKEELGTLYVYTDTTCGYCRKLHLEIDTLLEAGVNVKYIPYPRSGTEESVPVSRGQDGQLVYGENQGLKDLAQVFCSDDPQTALTEIKAGVAGNKYDTQEYQDNKESCNEKVKSGYASGQRVGLSGTPFLYLDNGNVLPGYQRAEVIINLLKQDKGE